MLDRLPERLREKAEATERATQMLADAKSSRNQVAGEPDACYMGVRKEDTAEWQAAMELERLRKIEVAARNVSETLNGGFIVCRRCGDQEDTTDIDFADDLREAIKITG